MKINFKDDGILEIDDARITYKNFSGAPGPYNDEGERGFAVIIPNQELADELKARGWNVTIKPPHDEDDEPFRYMKVKIKYRKDRNGNVYGPEAYLVTNDRKNELNQDTIGCYDNIAIARVDMDIRPYNWERPNGDSGRTAYLNAICVTQKVSRFADDDRFGGYEDEENVPF